MKQIDLSWLHPHLNVEWARTAIAGGIASLALLLESSPETRWLLAQYTSVRAAQCIYEYYSKRNSYLTKIGNWMYTAIFAISSGQLVYSFCMQPNALDREYQSFLTRVTRLSPVVIQTIRCHLHDRFLNFHQLEATLEKCGATIPMEVSLKSSPAMIGCDIIHPEEMSCSMRIIKIWPYIFKLMFPVYASLHTVPPLVFLSKRVIKEPLGFLSTCLKNSIRSSSFMATYIILFQTLLCGHRELFRRGWIHRDHRSFYWLFGFLSSASVLLEKESRRTELTLYLLPKALVALLRMSTRPGWIVFGGEFYLFASSMAIIMAFYRHDQQCVSHVVSRVLKYFLKS